MTCKPYLQLKKGRPTQKLNSAERPFLTALQLLQNCIFQKAIDKVTPPKK